MSKKKLTTKDFGPRVFFPPPLIVLFVVLVALAVSQYFQRWVMPNVWLRTLGCAGGMVALACVFSSLWQFKKMKTSVEPWQPSRRLITTGIFARTRNPIYLAFLVAQVSLGVFWGNGVVVGFTVVSYITLDYCVVRREETYLEKIFSQAYRDYKSKVPRWL